MVWIGELHPFDRAKPRLSRRVRSVRLRVKLEPLGLRAGESRGSLSRGLRKYEDDHGPHL
jgi:hypothetical protein